MVEMADCYEEIGDYGKAEELFCEVGKMSSGLNCQLPMFYKRRGRVAEAEMCYRLIITLGKDNNCFACYKLSSIYKSQGKINQAIEVVEKGLLLSSDNPFLTLAMGDLLETKSERARERVMFYRSFLDRWPRMEYADS